MKKTNALSRSDVARSSPFEKSLLHRSGIEWKPGDVQQAASVGLAGPASVRTLLVPLDGSLQAEHALPHALAIARRSGATLRIVHVHSPLDHVEPWHFRTRLETNERRKRAKQDYLWDVADRIRRTDLVRVETILIDSSDTKESLLTAAGGTDLVVIASRRRGLLRRLFSPSIADELRHSLSKPVLFVRGYPAPVDLTGDPIARRILVPMDGSPLAERILDPVTAIGRLEAAAITLMNVQNAEWTNGVFEHTNPPSYLVGIARKVNQALPLVDAQIVTTDRSIAVAISSYAERRKIDLIALAVPVDERVPRFLRRNVVDSLVRQTDLPILALGVDVVHKRAVATTE